MTVRTKLLAAASAATLVCGLIILWVAHRRSDDAALHRSLESLLTEHLKLSYTVERSVLSAADSDQGGQWWIVLSQPLKEHNLAQWDSILAPADPIDLAYYRKSAAETLLPSRPLDQFKLLRGETALGPGSICERLPCDIAVLVQPDSVDMYVFISKT